MGKTKGVILTVSFRGYADEVYEGFHPPQVDQGVIFFRCSDGAHKMIKEWSDALLTEGKIDDGKG